MATDETSCEGTGETVGEARWAATRELERRFPGLDKEAIDFQTLSEGERGLMGVGREPARVLARLLVLPSPEASEAARAARPAPAREERRPRPSARPRTAAPVLPDAEGPLADRVGEVVGAICDGIGLGATVHVGQGADGLVATVEGDDLGLLIGKHGHTIDAVQYLVNAIVLRGEENAAPIVVDAQDYRRRREAVLRDTAERAAQEALATGQPVSLEPMSSAERKIVHLVLQDHAGVVTESGGREPNRCVVVRPGDDA
ncbi:MAG: RNA-binding cell elongation regulator Jag/EloR [Gaiellales bacterium]